MFTDIKELLVDDYKLRLKSDYTYVIYIKNSNCPGYLSREFETFFDVKRYIIDIEKKSFRYGKIFYIDNSFYDNYYQNCVGGTYYKVFRRKNNEWEYF